MPRKLRAEGLVKFYHRRRVVNGVGIDVNRGEVVGLLGPNGAGKTTVFYMMVGIERPNEGKIFLDEKDITRYPMYRRAREGIGYLSQEPSVFRNLTVEENIMAILETRKNIDKKDRKKRLEELLEDLQISHLTNSKAYTLSGGERRRLEICRTLVTEPSFILLDEPFTGIDPIAVFEIQKIVHNLKKNGYGILITDHSVRETLEITDHAYIMYEGKILFSGTSEELIKSEKAREIYLGERFTM
ncbi:MAG: LPS export ABC transporter ATP-binding protein [Candidatus Omnitrophica bacterium]|nr:LPS export ABC transporter ATP-binding protein [Candidatus Omnitrophota bacterium]